MEQGDVKDLKDWERSILREVHPDYEPDDDSSDEEQIAIRKAREEESKQREETNTALASAGAKKR